MKNKHRLNLLFPQSLYDRLYALALLEEITVTSTTRKLLNIGFRIILAQNKGETIVIRKEDGTEKTIEFVI